MHLSVYLQWELANLCTMISAIIVKYQACGVLLKIHFKYSCLDFLYMYIHFAGMFCPRDLRKWIGGWTCRSVLWGRRWPWKWWRKFTSLEWRGPTRIDAGFKWTNTRISTSTTKVKPSPCTSSLAVLFHFILASRYSCKWCSCRVASYLFGKVPADIKLWTELWLLQ